MDRFKKVYSQGIIDVMEIWWIQKPESIMCSM